MGVTCIIDFDNNPYGTFFAGQVVTGKVTLKLDKQKLAKALTLTISGFAETHWTESTGTGKDRSTDTFSGREDYIASQTYLSGSPVSTEVALEPGVHVYNFACQIPATCPSSIEGHYGRIRYLVRVAMVRPWKFDQSYTRCFTVLKLMDLNYDSPLLRVPAHCESQKTYCCWPCTSEPLQLQLTLERTGFVPGQVIPITMLVTNDSHIRIEDMQMSLIMMITYYASHLSRTHSRNERIVVTKMMGDAVPNHCKKQFKYFLKMPATPPTCFNLCKIVQITYSVDVEARVKGCHRNEVISVPVTVGSIPLTQHVPMQPREMGSGMEPQSLDPNALTYAPQMPTAPEGIPWDPSIAPPNYEEALHMRDTLGNSAKGSGEIGVNLNGSGFAPLYPIFNIPEPTAPMDPSLHTDENMNAPANTSKGGTWL